MLYNFYIKYYIILEGELQATKKAKEEEK